MASYEISRVGETKDQLGEGLLWDAQTQQIYWTDALGRVLHRLDEASGERVDFETPGDIGAFALRENGGGIVSLGDGFYFIDLSTGEVERAGEILNHNDGLRFNDGAVDRQGRFFVRHDACSTGEGRGAKWRTLAI